MSTTIEATKQRSPRVIIAVLAFSGGAMSLFQTLMVPTIPEMPTILHVSADDASWVVTATLLASAIATPSLSRLADMFGKRRLLLISVGLMLLGSVMGIITTSFSVLLVARALQGCSLALVPIAMSVLRDELPRERVVSAVAMVSASMVIGMAMGLPLGGFVYDTFGWHGIFWFSTGIGIIMYLAIAIVVKESTVRTGGKFDLRGALLLSIALTSLLLGVTKGGAWGWTSSTTMFTLGLSLVVFALWAPMQLRTSQPLVDLRTSAQRPVMLTNLTALMIGAASFANLLITTELLQMPEATGYGLAMSSTAAGIAMLPTAIAAFLFAGVSGRVTKKFGARVTICIGMTVVALGFISRIFLTASLFQIILAASIVSAASTFAAAAMPTVIMGNVPITETAAANGLNTVVRNIGSTMGSAVVTALLAASTIVVLGRQLPELLAFQHVFIFTAVTSLIAAVAALALPRRNANDSPIGVTEVKGPNSEHEVVAQGMVVDAHHVPIHDAVVHVVALDGTPIDWERTDAAGVFSIVLPKAGSYRAVVTAEGWQEHMQTVIFDRNSMADAVVLTEAVEVTNTQG